MRSVSTGTFFTSKPSKVSTVTAELIFDAPDVGTVEAVSERAIYRRLLRQYLYFCSSKTNELKPSASVPSIAAVCVSICTFVPVKQDN